MSEGEFKKRIKSLFSDIWDRSAQEVDEEDIQKIINDAQKEFPLPSQAKGGCVDYSIAVIEYYKKWHGKLPR